MEGVKNGMGGGKMGGRGCSGILLGSWLVGGCKIWGGGLYDMGGKGLFISYVWLGVMGVMVFCGLVWYGWKSIVCFVVMLYFLCLLE